MKNLTALLLTMLFFCSCSRMYVPMGKDPVKRPKPFVTLKNGATIESKKVTGRKGKLKTDSATYKTSDISAYSDGKSTYVSINGGFVPRIYEGDINVYETSSSHTSTEFVGHSAGNPSGWHTSSHNHTKTYLQKEGTDEFKLFNYKTLKGMIPPEDPGFKYLKLYKKQRTLDQSIMAGGLALFFVGGAILGKSVMSPTSKGQTEGAVIMIAGPVAILTGFTMLAFNRLNLRRTIASHNGLVVK